MPTGSISRPFASRRCDSCQAIRNRAQFTGLTVRTGWYLIEFDCQEYGSCNIQRFESLLQNCGFLNLIDDPGLLTGSLWMLKSEKKAEAHLTQTPFEVN
jgi:hypothetical protein